jgi:hypothetical protein
MHSFSTERKPTVTPQKAPLSIPNKGNLRSRSRSCRYRRISHVKLLYKKEGGSKVRFLKYHPIFIKKRAWIS